MDQHEIFRKYLHDTTNNEPMVDAIMHLHSEAGTEPEGNEMFADALYSMVPSLDLCQTICNIRDLVFDLGQTTEVEPSYHDARVADHPDEKLQSISFVVPLKSVGNPLADSLRAMRKSYHDRVFDPMNTEFRQETPYEKLEREIFAHR